MSIAIHNQKIKTEEDLEAKSGQGWIIYYAVAEGPWRVYKARKKLWY